MFLSSESLFAHLADAPVSVSGIHIGQVQPFFLLPMLDCHTSKTGPLAVAAQSGYLVTEVH
jgi:hypothetical protein